MAISNDRAIQMVLKALFEPLVMKLMHCKPADVIRVVGFENYKNYEILTVERKRNNFYYIGESLQNMFCGIIPAIHDDPTSSARENTKNPRKDDARPAQPLKYFYACKVPGKYAEPTPFIAQNFGDYIKPWRQLIYSKLHALVKKEMVVFDSCMI